MRVALIALLFAGPAFAQDQSPVVGAACGPKGVSFTEKKDDSRHTATQPEPGKAH